MESDPVYRRPVDVWLSVMSRPLPALRGYRAVPTLGWSPHVVGDSPSKVPCDSASALATHGDVLGYRVCPKCWLAGRHCPKRRARALGCRPCQRHLEDARIHGDAALSSSSMFAPRLGVTAAGLAAIRINQRMADHRGGLLSSARACPKAGPPGGAGTALMTAMPLEPGGHPLLPAAGFVVSGSTAVAPTRMVRAGPSCPGLDLATAAG